MVTGILSKKLPPGLNKETINTHSFIAVLLVEMHGKFVGASICSWQNMLEYHKTLVGYNFRVQVDAQATFHVASVEMVSLCSLQHIGWHTPQHGTVLDCDILDGNLGHCACDSNATFGAVKLHCVTFGECANLYCTKLGTSIVHRIIDAVELFVCKIAEHDRSVDFLDCCVGHFKLLLLQYVHIIAFWQLLVNHQNGNTQVLHAPE
jgi:hypothetical protein